MTCRSWQIAFCCMIGGNLKQLRNPLSHSSVGGELRTESCRVYDTPALIISAICVHDAGRFVRVT